MDPALREVLRTGEADETLTAIVRLAPGQAPPPHLTVVTRFGDIATVRVRRGDVGEAYASDAIASFKAIQTLMPEATSADDTGAETAGDRASAAGTDLRREPGWPTGRGVVVAALDWGLDLTHPDFRTPEGRTRLRGLWDQGARYDPRHPNRYGYGRIFTRAEIDTALGHADPFAALGYEPRRADRGGGTHGTHVLGIAAGNGRGGGPEGVAPEAELLFVHMGTSAGRAGAQALTDSAAVLEGLDFVHRAAGEAATCINLSMGTHGGPHDGSSLVEAGIDAFLLHHGGRYVVQSTGNYFARRVHAGGQLAAGGSARLPLVVEADDTTPNDLEVWYAGSDAFDVAVEGPDGRRHALARLGETAAVLDRGQEIGRLHHRRHDPNNHDHQVLLRLDAPAATGTWTLVLQARRIVDGRWHAWIERDGRCASCQSTFPSTHAVRSSTTGSICNGRETIVVGACDGRHALRPLGRFSSAGPTRDGRRKPDLVAPGVRVLAARSRPAGGQDAPLLTRMSGTSMAAPHVTGTAALLCEVLDTRPGHRALRDLLRRSCQPHLATDPLAMHRSGAGRLDTAAALRLAQRLRPTPPLPHAPRETTMSSPPLPPITATPAEGRPDHVATAEVLEPAIETMEALASDADDADDADEGRRWRRASLPLITPVIGPGGLGAAVVAPLGGTAIIAPLTPMAAAAPAAAPATPAASCTCAGAGASGGTPGVAVASAEPTVAAETLEAAWREPFRAEADESAEDSIRESPGQTVADLVRDLLARAGWGPGEDEAMDTHGLASEAVAARLFDHFTGRRHVLPAPVAARFDVVAGPGGFPGGLRAGDWLLRRGEGGIAHVSIIATPRIWPGSVLAAQGWQRENGRPGGFVHVIDLAHGGRLRGDRFARRICDGGQRVPSDTLLLRLRTPHRDEAGEAFHESVDARWLQQALNQVLGLALVVDGDIGPRTRAAIRQFQTQNGLVADGIVGPLTEAALRRALGEADAGGGSTRQGLAGGGGGSTGSIHRATPCATLDTFAQGRADLTPAHHALLIALARRIQREGVREVDITGFASSEGDETANLALGLQRAEAVARGLRETLERMRPGSSAGVTMRSTSRGEGEPLPGATREQNRRVDVCLRSRAQPPPRPQVVPVQTQLFRVTGKSFIAVIGSNIGRLNCGFDVGPIRVPGASNPALRAFAAATDVAFSEDPRHDRVFTAPPPENKGYRLFSQGRIAADVRDSQLVAVRLDGGLRTDAGKEYTPQLPPPFPEIPTVCDHAPPLIVDQAFSTRRISPNAIQFRWGVKGRPPERAENLFNAICARTCFFIWHEIVGTVELIDGRTRITRLFIQGSRFPSHRAWVDGTEVHHVPQGPMSNLWDADPRDPTRVR